LKKPGSSAITFGRNQSCRRQRSSLHYHTLGTFEPITIGTIAIGIRLRDPQLCAQKKLVSENSLTAHNRFRLFGGSFGRRSLRSPISILFCFLHHHIPGTAEPITIDTIQTSIDRRGDWNPTAGSTTLRPEETCATSELELACEKSGPTSLSDIDITHLIL
ncbi:hypothetical protein CSKR_102793, partial [Clonorchis sinensis]